MTDSTDRRAFQPFNDADSMVAMEVGKDIYLTLREQFPNGDNYSRDIIMNSLCYALSCLVICNVGVDNRPIILQIIHKILSDNTKA